MSNGGEDVSNCDTPEPGQKLKLVTSEGPQPEGLWTLEDVCDFLKMGKTWVRQQVAAGTLPVVRLGTAVRFKPSAIKAWVERQEKGSR